jgi:DNA (cytosine-5)-methyltransferase 1
MFIIGIHRTRKSPLTAKHVERFKREAATVRSALADLESPLRLPDLPELPGYDVWRIARRGRPSAYAREARSADKTFTSHRAIEHKPEIIARFATVRPGEMDPIGRHPRLALDSQCPTLRAGTGADKGSYQSVRPLHPVLNRVITVREAARLQGFPDSHLFHPTTWHSFRMIGNSVSPIMAKAVFTAIYEHLMLKSQAGRTKLRRKREVREGHRRPSLPVERSAGR